MLGADHSSPVAALLAGDFYTVPALDKRGGTGDVTDVWRAFGECFAWVAGNHDLFGDRNIWRPLVCASTVLSGRRNDRSGRYQIMSDHPRLQALAFAIRPVIVRSADSKRRGPRRDSDGMRRTSAEHTIDRTLPLRSDFVDNAQVQTDYATGIIHHNLQRHQLMRTTLEEEHCQLRDACFEATRRLNPVAEGLRKLIEDEALISDTPRDVKAMMETAVEAISETLRGIQAVCPVDKSEVPSGGNRPTRQQGQFLAFIREYIFRNSAGVAPGHADFQRYFNLTPPSVNSMLIRLEQRGFMRREPGKARAIELVVSPDWIPALDRPFEF